ncbi:hypothetical protein ILP92_14525 [Maribius pontilimi]|uniref:Uncharacterized protein n=1 Tax=Palleronia pontilimi TaxID=1964209 RepID=A0A934IL17_9RHOB|nr:hypothetical protein [Palleronia pontilimi]MBJ3763964.1 hypothetical protein [Palleronia pontilimi]
MAIVASCGRVGESRLNPLNWGSRSTNADAMLSEGTRADPRPLIGQIDTLTASPTQGGAILRATGIAATQGYFVGDLVAVPTDDPRVLAFEFRAFPPLEPKPVSTPRSREVTVARFLTSRELTGVNELRVSAAQNARAVRR